MKRLCLAIFFVSSLFAASGCGDLYFTNPVIPGDLPDPTVVAFEGSYYAAMTSCDWAPFYPVYKSSDLLNWKPVGHIFENRPEWTSGDFWAPELFVRDGEVLCYYTARRASDNMSCIAVARAATPEGQFEDFGPLVDMGTEDIDAFVFEQDGELYITWKAYGLDERPIEILGCRLSADGLSLEGEPFTLLCDEDRIGMEGACIFEYGEYKYMLYAARGCCGAGSDYEVRLARAASILGPWEYCPSNPVLSGKTDEVKSIGHGTVVEGPAGRLFYMCHGYLAGAGFNIGRQPFLHELEPTEDGWMRFVNGSKALVSQWLMIEGAKQDLARRGARGKKAWSYVDKFSGEAPDAGWSWCFKDCEVAARTRGGRLELASAAGAPAAYCRLAPAENYDMSVEVDPAEGENKGLCVYCDKDNYIAYYLDTEGRIHLDTCTEGTVAAVVGDLYCPDMDSKKVVFELVMTEGVNPYFQLIVGGDIYDSKVAGDASFLLRWDRVFRPGLWTDSPSDRPAVFDNFRLSRLSPKEVIKFDENLYKLL